MLTYNELKEKCNCWKGYKRVPGTKPCAEDSCMKEELEKHHVLAFGRMNPITSGHEAVVNKLHSVAKEHGASHSLVVSHSQDAKKNPLTGEQKVAHAKNAFPGTNVSSASKDKPTILHHAAAAHAAGATHLHVVAGSDRHEEMHNLLHKYNGKDSGHGHYNFKKITVHSSGERDPDAEGTTGISASKMREHAASGNKAEFHKGAPSNMKPEHKDAMYNDVRKGMNIKEETVQEELRPDMGAGAYVNDFIKSTNPRFNNKSKEERRKMAIGAFMAAKSRLKEGRGLADKYWSMAQDRKETADENKDNHEIYHTHMADHHDHMSRYHEELGQHTHAQSHADKAEIHHEKSMQRPNRKSTVKEGTLQGNIGGGDAMNTTTSAPSASTAKDTTMGKKIKGFKFFNGENDKQMNMNQPVKEATELDSPSKHAEHIVAADTDDEAKKRIAKVPTKHLQSAHHWNLGYSGGEHKYTTHVKSELQKRGAMLSASESSKRFDEEVKKEDPPFDGPYKSTFKKPNNPNRTGMDAARSLAQRSMDQLNKKKPVNEETLDERNKANALMRKTMDASRGAKFKLKNPVPDADPKHKTARDHNVAIGRALRNEATTGNPGFGYHGQHKTENDADEAYKKIHAHVKSLTDSDDKTVKHYLDSAHGRHLVGHENDHDHIKKDFKKFSKYYKPEMHEATAQKGVNVDKVNTAGQEPHDEKFETAPKTVSKIKKVKEENMKSYKEFLQGLDEKLIGKQHKIDKNKNGEVDGHDFELLRKEEVELDESTYASADQAKNVVAALKQKHNDGNYSVKQTKNGHKVVHAYDSDAKVKSACKSVNEEADHLLEYESDESGVYRHTKKATYGTSYQDPEGADETAADMKKKEKKAAGRKTGQSTGSYKPRATMSKLKSAGATYK